MNYYMKQVKNVLEFKGKMARLNQKRWNKLLYKYCDILGQCYTTGDFSDIFPYLAEDCVWESQWRLSPETGKEAVEKYFINKGLTLQKTGSFPRYLIVEFIDELNLIENTEAKVNGQESIASVGLLYEAGKIALFMAQTLEDITNGMIIDLTLDERQQISRINFCMPELFKFKKYEHRVKDDTEGVRY